MKSLKILFYLSIIFIVFSVLTITLGQLSNYEFANHELRNKVIDVMLWGLPTAILLSLLRTIQPKGKLYENIVLSVFTLMAAFSSVAIIVSMLFTFGFSTYVDETVLYQSKTQPSKSIRVQREDQGIFGHGEYRIVQTQAFLYLWNKVEIVDTATINKSEWIYVNEKL